MNKQDTLQLLKQYEKAYYSGESLVSDEIYDAIKDKYVKEHGEYDFVPNEGNTGFKRVKHKYPLLSLDKEQVSNTEELRKRLKKLWPVIIQPKFDGLSIEIQEDLRFITRGNGEEGDDVTAQCSQISDIDILENAFREGHGPLRAEILMTHSDFKILNEERINQGLEAFSNCRNAAAGMLRNLDLNKIKGLTIMIYEELGSTIVESESIRNLTVDIGEENLKYCESIQMTPVFEPADIDAAIEFLENLDSYRNLIDYDIDGWVVKSNINNSLEAHGGYTSHHPKNAFAVKGEAKGAWTRIKSITWQVGKENITPVAELEPVEIDGSVISRCTLHNVSVMKALGLNRIISIGGQTLVRVIKANDVIPKMVEVKEEIFDSSDEQAFTITVNNKTFNPVSLNMSILTTKYPSKCPVCNANTAIKETDSEILICTNEDCEAKVIAKASLMASREALDITGLSEGTIVKIMESYHIDSHEDILLMTKDEILELEGFAEKSAQKLYDSIQIAIKKQSIDKVLYASAIPLIGLNTAKDICKVYTAEELSNILSKEESEAIKDLCKIKGIGKETAKSFVQNKSYYESMSAVIKEIMDIAVKQDINKEILTFCITGQREPFKSIIEESGHKVSGSVSKKTKALIDSSGDLTTSKAIKAKELGIPIIQNVEELRKLI